MPTLRDPFDVVHQRDGKGGLKLDYVEWSQVATRLDEAMDVMSWSFSIIALGPDWCHGRLQLVGMDGDIRILENVGYAENADADWKKEPLKDAVSDALKRCAALAGVARYLYDKDAGPRASTRPQNGAGRPVAPQVASVSTPRPASPVTPPQVEPDWMAEVIPPKQAVAVASGRPMTTREILTAADEAQIPVDFLAKQAKNMYGGTGMLKDLTAEQRGELWASLR